MIGAAFAPLVVVAVLAYLMRRQISAARTNAAGEFVLEYGNAWRVAGMIVAAAWTGLFIFLFISQPPKKDDIPAMLLLVALATGLTLPYIVTVYGVAYRLTAEGFQKHSPWSRDFEVRWHEIKRVSFNDTLGQFVLETTAGTARVSRFLNGMRDFRDSLQKNVPEQTWAPARKSLDRFCR